MIDDELRELLKTFGWFGSESWWKVALPRFRLLIENALQEHLKTLRDTQEEVDISKAKIVRLRDALQYHLRLHKNFPAHGSARMMEMENQLQGFHTSRTPLDRSLLPNCDCDGCMRARDAIGYANE